MDNKSKKQLGFVARLGSDFNSEEIPAAHAILDRCGAPRRLRGAGLTLPERIAFLHGRLVTAREAVRFAAVMSKQIFILSRDEWKSCIPEEYRTLEVKS
jgi:hypothetical protein